MIPFGFIETLQRRVPRHIVQLIWMKLIPKRYLEVYAAPAAISTPSAGYVGSSTCLSLLHPRTGHSPARTNHSPFRGNASSTLFSNRPSAAPRQCTGTSVRGNSQFSMADLTTYQSRSPSLTSRSPRRAPSSLTCISMGSHARTRASRGSSWS